MIARLHGKPINKRIYSSHWLFMSTADTFRRSL